MTKLDDIKANMNRLCTEIQQPDISTPKLIIALKELSFWIGEYRTVIDRRIEDSEEKRDV